MFLASRFAFTLYAILVKLMYQLDCEYKAQLFEKKNEKMASL